MIIHIPYVSLGIVDCLFYNGRFPPAKNSQNKMLEMLVYTPMEYNSADGERDFY